MQSADTIAAIATAPGRGGIGVVRVSGKNLNSMMSRILGRQIPPRTATLTDFLDHDGSVIDRGIAIYFQAPHSYTGEDVLELQGHGGQIVLKMLLGRILGGGARIAEPGEFTRRAYLNDKLDLAQAESVADLIDASTQGAARSAMRSLAGEFSDRINRLVGKLIDLRMLVEATLDFPEEEIDFLDAGNARSRLQAIRDELQGVLERARAGSMLREGVHIVLVGQPNVGKSSLLNRLANDEVAIVTEVPGTTRDVIRQSIELEGIPVHIIDTAGLRETDELVEKIGIARTKSEIAKADLILYLTDFAHGVNEQDLQNIEDLPKVPVLRVWNKIDLAGGSPSRTVLESGPEIHLSAKTGAGIDLLKQSLLELLGWSATGEGVFMARERHLEALREAGGFLENAALTIGQSDLFAEDLRLAQNSLAKITGEFSADDLLGEIFTRFCIGK